MLCAPWEVFDSTDEELKALHCKIAALRSASLTGPGPPGVEQLAAVVEREMCERQLSTKILFNLTPATTTTTTETTRNTGDRTETAETTQREADGNTVNVLKFEPASQPDTALASLPPNDTELVSRCARGGTAVEGGKISGPAVVARDDQEAASGSVVSSTATTVPRRGLWDSSGESSTSIDEDCDVQGYKARRGRKKGGRAAPLLSHLHTNHPGNGSPSFVMSSGLTGRRGVGAQHQFAKKVGPKSKSKGAPTTTATATTAVARGIRIGQRQKCRTPQPGGTATVAAKVAPTSRRTSAGPALPRVGSLGSGVDAAANPRRCQSSCDFPTERSVRSPNPHAERVLPEFLPVLREPSDASSSTAPDGVVGSAAHDDPTLHSPAIEKEAVSSSGSRSPRDLPRDSTPSVDDDAAAVVAAGTLPGVPIMPARKDGAACDDVQEQRSGKQSGNWHPALLSAVGSQVADSLLSTLPSAGEVHTATTTTRHREVLDRRTSESTPVIESSSPSEGHHESPPAPVGCSNNCRDERGGAGGQEQEMRLKNDEKNQATAGAPVASDSDCDADAPVGNQEGPFVNVAVCRRPLSHDLSDSTTAQAKFQRLSRAESERAMPAAKSSPAPPTSCNEFTVVAEATSAEPQGIARTPSNYSSTREAHTATTASPSATATATAATQQATSPSSLLSLGAVANSAAVVLNPWTNRSTSDITAGTRTRSDGRVDDAAKSALPAAAEASDKSTFGERREGKNSHGKSVVGTVAVRATNRSRRSNAPDKQQSATQPRVTEPCTVAVANYSSFFASFDDFLIDPTTLMSFHSGSGASTGTGAGSCSTKLAAHLRFAHKQWLVEQLQVCLAEFDENAASATSVLFAQSAMPLRYKVQQSREEVYALVSTTLEHMSDPRPWEETGGPCWNLWWTWRKPKPKERIWLRVQTVNHIPQSSQLTRKDLLKRNVQRYSRGKTASAAGFNVLPVSFTLPQEYVAFTEAFSQHRGLWILKPVGMSRGRGISIVADITDVVYTDPVVVQRYVERPYLIQGHKFDLRLYVVVTQFNPLEAFVSTLGFARIACLPYEINDTSNRFVHLTNTAVSGVGKSAQLARRDLRRDCKWDLVQTAAYFNDETGHDWSFLWALIKDTILRALCCAETGIAPAPCCFELFGFDVLLDEDARPWILEVNSSPALDIDSSIPCDGRIKRDLMWDIVQLVHPLAYDVPALLDTLCADLNGNSRASQMSRGERDVWLNTHMERILYGQVPREYGALPKELGHFEPLAPGISYERIRKQKRCAL